MKATIQLLILSILLFTYNSCGKECTDYTNPQCSNYDPCRVIPKTSADFVTEISVGNRWIEVDMANFRLSLWQFRALDTTADEYLWEVGADKFTTKSFTLSGFPDKRSIPIKLTVKRHKPNTTCYPDDKGIATLTKNIYSEYFGNFQYFYYTKNSPTGSNLPVNTSLKTLNGKYKGYNKRNPNFIFDFEFKYYYGEKTDQIVGLNGKLGNWSMSVYDFVNIPYYGQSIYNSFFEEGKFQDITCSPQSTYVDFEVDGVKVLDRDRSSLDLQAAHLGCMGGMETNYKVSKLTRYYSFFKSYLYLHPKDKDKITVEYWYRDTITRHILKDTFIGTRVP